MLRPDFPAMRPTAPTAALVPLAPLRASGAALQAGFGAVYRQLHDEVQEVIDHGWAERLPALSAEGWQRRATTTAAEGAAPAAAAASPDQRAFLDDIAPWAREAAAQLGVSADLVSAHAALESGWGQRPIRDAQGRDAHNLFGIKAHSGWRGEHAETLTTEFEDGAAVRKTERFRSYPDYASAFRDYAQLLRNDPRYRAALNTGGDAVAFAQGLARGGYATDPAYAAKLARVAARVQSLD